MRHADIRNLQNKVLGYYDQHGRHELPWRQSEADGTFSVYKIMVSELMLQQTQVIRVIPKYQAFLKLFPSVEHLARAPLAAVLTAWSGLGYNRRAKFLWLAAQKIVQEYQGIFPHTKIELVGLPGVGPNTAGAIMAYAYNEPVAFIETNIRTVFIHHFFPEQERISDKDIMPLVEQSLAETDSRTWYWALMDYGVHIKRSIGNTARAGSGYVKQATFQGSRRQIRGGVIRLLTEGPQTFQTLASHHPDDRLPGVLDDLVAESLVQNDAGIYRLHML